MNTQIKMRNSTKSLLIASVIALFTTQVNAQWQPVIPNDMMKGQGMPFNETKQNGVPWNNPSMMPITWGDCIPVPVEHLPIGVTPMPVAPMPMGPVPMRPVPFEAQIPMMNQQSAFPPAPVPMYGAIPEPLPLLPPIPVAPACEDNSNAINQMKGDLEASNKKIAELKQVISDTQNQLQDSLSLVEQHTQAQSLDRNNIQALKSKIAQLNKTSSDMMSFKEKENSTLKEQLANAKANAGKQAQHLLSLDKTTQELGALKTQLAQLTSENNDLKTKLSVLLKKSSMELGTLKQANQEQGSKFETLKKQLVDFKIANQTLQAQLASKRTEAASQGKKMLALKQSSTQLSSLKLAFQEKDKELAALKKQLSDAQNANKALQVNLAAQKTDTAMKGKEMMALKQASTQFSSLKLAHQEKLKENEALKKQLKELTAGNNSLKAQVASLRTEAAARNKQILGLKQASSQLLLLQQTCKGEQSKVSELQGQLDSCKKDNEKLSTEIADLKKKFGSQEQKITSLMVTTQDLTAKKEALNAKLSKATADSDQDGILDSVDKCPGTPSGQEVDALGCFADTDKDGVANSADQCPSSPANSKVNAKGCQEVKDTDKDGVADATDLCPTSKEGDKVNDFGCAETENITLKGVNFKLGSAKLTQSSFPILDSAAETILKNPNLKIEIAGHTDNQGNAASNQRLSQVRANSVMIYLIRKGVAAQSLTAKGYGEEQPIASNDTQEGLATNRRVELKISK